MILPDEVAAALELLLSAFKRHKVDVIAIGGLAVANYGHQRISGGPVKGEIKADLDFWYNPTTENYFNLVRVLKVLDVDVQEIEKAVFDPKKSFLKVPHKTFHVDFLPQVAGLESYRDCKRDSSVMVVGSHQVAVLGYDDLLKNKRAVGRAIDNSDIAALEKKKSNDLGLMDID